ncbi:MAG: tetratricopeptide repeat protein, partial [Terriglobia bacterium]
QEELQVSFPKSLYVQIKSPDLKPVITEQGSLTVYSWKSSNSEVNTTSQPADAEPSFPTVEITTFRNWQEVGRWWATLESQAVKPTPDIRAKAAELTKGMTTDDEKLRAIYHYVSTEFRYISVSFGIGRYAPHTASEVLSNMYGDCKDKHVLLASLLQAAGLDAYPALINATAKIDPEVPSPAQFDHVISVIPEGKDLVWLDTTAEVAPFGFLLTNLRGKKTLLMPRGKEPYLAKTPADPPFKMFQRFYANGKLSDDGTFTGKMRQIARGDYGVVLRILFFLTPQSQWQNLVQRISTLSGFGGEVSNVTASDPSDTDKPFEYSYDYIRKDFGDWSAGKTVPATMPIFLPAWTITGKQPLTPLKLGSPNDIMLKSSIELPKGYTTVSFPTSLSREDFADYTSSCYSREGVFYTSRRLTIKEREIPVAERAMYEYFRTTVNGDQDRTITVAKDAAAANNPDVSVEALGLMDQAYDASQDGNLKDALADAQKTIKLTPKWSEGWDELAFADLGLGRNQEALSALHTAIQLAPKSPRAYVILGMHLEKSTHYGQARQVWRNLLKQDPGNWIAGIHLGALLLQERRYNEAFAVLEPAAKQSGELADPRYDAMLGVVALRAGKTQEGISALETAVKLNPIPFILNNAAYYLADANVDMAEAQSYAEKAIKADEATAAQISLDTLQDKDLGAMVMLAHEWDTLGWVYFREDKLQDAEKYLKAAWNLEQAPAAADHLGQLYEKLGRRQAAIHMYALSAADPDAPRGASDANLVRLVPVNAKRDALIDRARAELSQMRTVQLGKMRGRTGTAEFWVLFLPGAKVEGVTFASGSEQLRSAAQSIAHAHFQAPLPDDSLTRIIRRGVLVCEGMGLNCDFTLLP